MYVKYINIEKTKKIKYICMSMVQIGIYTKCCYLSLVGYLMSTNESKFYC